MVALRILVPPVRVRVLPGQRRKIANRLVSRLAIFIFQNLAKGVHKPPGKERYARLRDKPLFLAALPHLFCHFHPPFLSFRTSSFSVFTGTCRHFRLLAVFFVTFCHSRRRAGIQWRGEGCFVDSPSSVEWQNHDEGKRMLSFRGSARNPEPPPNEEGTSNDRGKRKTALIGPRGRQPRAGKGRGLCERSEFRSPRARRRRPSEKARYRAAVLLGSFFSPKRRMNKNAPWIPHQAGNDIRQGNGRAQKGV